MWEKVNKSRAAKVAGETQAGADVLVNIKRAGWHASALAALAKTAEIQGHGADVETQRARDFAELLRAAALFMAKNQNRLREIIRYTRADEAGFSRALHEAIFENAGKDGKKPAEFDADAVIASIERALVRRDRLQRLGVDSSPAIQTPSAVPALLMLEAVDAAERDKFEKLPAKKSTKTAVYKIKIDENLRVVLRNNKGERFGIKVEDVEKFRRNRAGATGKMAALVLMKAGQNMRDGILSEDWILLQPDELLALQMYESRAGAIAGINLAADGFQGLSITGAEKHGRPSAWYPFFKGIEPAPRGGYFVKLNDAIDWRVICAQYTVLPWYFFRLENRAASLLWRIYFLARQNAKKIKERGYFTVALSTVAEWLFLLDIDKTTKPGRDIKEPVYNAIKNILEQGGGERLTLETATGEPLNPDAHVTEWIKGRLKVDIRRAESYAKLSEIFNKNKAVKAAAEKAEKAAEKAGKKGLPAGNLAAQLLPPDDARKQREAQE